MKIGIVLHPYGEEKPTGLGRAAFEITKAIVEGDAQNEYEIFLKGNHEKKPQFSGNYIVTELSGGLFWLDKGLKRRKDLDAILFLTPSALIFTRLKNTFVVVHDLAYFHTDTFSFKEFLVRIMFKNAFSKAEHIISVSNATKEDLIKTLSIKEEKISVAQNGFTNVCSDSTKETSVPKPFFLSVSVVKPRKNTEKIVEAFISFKKKDTENQQLVVAGKYGEDDYFRKIIARIEEEGLIEQVHFLGFVSDAELGGLFKETKALIYPTLFEGFGMTILEGMGCGAPVITSDLPPHREAAGEAALFVNPNSSEDIQEAMNQIVSPEINTEMKEKSLEQAKQFSWKKAGEDYRKIIKAHAKS